MKMYLGDGVYAEDDGSAVVLTAENGIAIQHRIVLESEVYDALELFVRRVAAQRDRERAAVEHRIRQALARGDTT